MKKIFGLAVLTTFLVGNFCFARNYDTDRNYIFVAAGGQGVYYLYCPSVYVEEYNPPHYQISGHFVHQGDYGETKLDLQFRYNFDRKIVYYRNKEDVWVSINPKNFQDLHYRDLPFANALFKTAYKMNFFNDL